MKKIIFGIFAHPDDESFGPAGTLLKETKAGTEVHLISLTAGDSGMNPDAVDDLGAVRLKEWQAAGTLIGAKSMTCLNYKDGTLSNKDMIEIGTQLIEIVQSSTRDVPSDCVIEFMSLDLNGLTGHIDHIVAARSACYAFYTLQADDSRMSRVRLFCLPKTQAPTHDTSWLYMEAGRSENDIDETIDATIYHDELRSIVHAHHTQRSDGERYLQSAGENLGKNHFIVRS